MYKRVKKRTHEILRVAPRDDPLSRIVTLFIMVLIILNVIAVILETVEGLSSRYVDLFTLFEVFSVAVFTIEYLLRLWSCTLEDEFEKPITGRIRYALTPLALVDLLAVLPFYLPMILPLDLRLLRALRLFRVARLLKMGRYSDSLMTLGYVFRIKKEELLMTALGVSVLLVLASSLMYHVENEAQPEAFSSIPAAMWWGVSTLTTVGYGDIYPITPVGKVLGAIIALLGIGMFALPAGILGSGFVEEMHRRRGKRRICPHCGKDIDLPKEGSSGPV